MSEPSSPAIEFEDAPLSRQQRMVWAAQQLDPGSDAFNVPAAYRLGGVLDLVALDSALRTVIGAHPVLRADVSVDADGEPRQRILPIPGHVLEIEDVREDQLRQRMAGIIAEPLPAAGRVRTRAVALRLADDDVVLLFVFDHVALDGLSVPVILRALAASYADHCAGVGEPGCDAPANPYFDYVRAQREHQNSTDGREEARFWDTCLPTDCSPPAALMPRADSAARRTDTAVVPITVPAGLSDVATELRVTPFAVLMTAFSLVLKHFLRSQDAVIAFPAVDWRRAEYADTVGLFTDNLVLHCPPTGGTGLRDVIRQVQDRLLDCLDYQGASHDGLWQRIRARNLESDGARVSAALSVEDAAWNDLEMAGVTVRRIKLAPADGKNDLLAFFEFEGGQVHGLLRYSVAVLDEPTASRLATAITVVLNQIRAGVDCPAHSVELIGDDDRRLVLDEWNPPPAPSATMAPLHADFVRQAAAAPGRLALLDDERRMSYGELDRASRELSGRLRELELPAGSTVAICVPRSIDYVVAVLAISRSGLAFLPVDLEQPGARRAFVLRDAAVSAAVVRDGEPVRGLPDVPTVDVRARRTPTGAEPDVSPDAVVYVIATSGSTGMPKSVVVPHRAITNHVRWKSVEYGFGEHDRFYFKTPPTFDASIWEFMAPLGVGASVVVATPSAHRDPARMITDMRGHGVTIAQFVPTLLKAVLAEGGLSTCDRIRLVFSGGEPLDWQTVREVRAKLGVATVNLFGPTEACIDASSHLCEAETGTAPPIGRSVANGQCYVLGPAGQLLPPGFAGELHLGGLPLALGYLNRPEQTAERFVPHPFDPRPQARLYRTGDIARFRADGELEYCGREDGQVKVRGIRVELDEIRALVLGVDGVSDAAVRVRRDADDTLVVYFVAAEDLGTAVLDELRTRLPSALVPSHAVRVDAFPTTSTGKVDFARLPVPKAGRELAGADAPRSSLERLLAGLWAEQLGTEPERIPRDVGFLQLGGTSMSLIRLHRRLTAEVSADIAITDLFKYSTVAAVAKALGDGRLTNTGNAHG